MPNEGASSVEPSREVFGLTRLERQVIALIVSGFSSEEMAAKFGISDPTLRLRIQSICDKLYVSNEFELILFSSPLSAHRRLPNVYSH